MLTVCVRQLGDSYDWTFTILTDDITFGFLAMHCDTGR